MCSSVVAGPNAVVSWRRSTPKSPRVPAAIIRMSCRVLGGGSIAFPRTPIPPALETAVTSGGYDTNPMPALTNGKRTPYSRVSRVLRGSRAATSPMGSCSPDDPASPWVDTAPPRVAAAPVPRSASSLRLPTLHRSTSDIHGPLLHRSRSRNAFSAAVELILRPVLRAKSPAHWSFTNLKMSAGKRQNTSSGQDVLTERVFRDAPELSQYV